MNARNVPGPLRFGAAQSVGHALYFVAVSLDGRHVFKSEEKDSNRGDWLRCKDCRKWCPNNEGGVRHNDRCAASDKYGGAWARTAVVQWAGAMALYECGASGDDAMVHLMWHHFMAENGVVPADNEWDDLGPFLGRLRKHGDEVMVKWMKEWKGTMSAVRKYNITDPLYAVAARPMEEGPIEAAALPVMEVVADGVEAGAQLPEADGVILIPLADDGLPLVELEAVADIIGGADAEMASIPEDALPVPDGEPAEMWRGEPAIPLPAVEMGADGNDPTVEISEVDAAIMLALADDEFPLGESEALMDAAGGRAGEAREPPEG